MTTVSLEEQGLHYLYALARDPVHAVKPSINFSKPTDFFKQHLLSTRELTRSDKPGKRKKRKAGATTPGGAVGNNTTSHKKKSVVQKRKKPMKRGSSPSHFHVPRTDENKFGPDYTHEMPGRDKVDNWLQSVGQLYYTQKELHPTPGYVWVNGEYDENHYSTLDQLMSPLRKSIPIDRWSPLEIATFEGGICRLGKDFLQISRLVKTKTTNEVVDFYYQCWKHSSHYRSWKALAKSDTERISTRPIPSYATHPSISTISVSMNSSPSCAAGVCGTTPALTPLAPTPSLLAPVS